MARTALHEEKGMSRIFKPRTEIIKPFYINRNRYIETEQFTCIGVEGHYTIRSIKPGIGVVRELSFKNLLTNVGLNALGEGGASFTRMHLGTGTANPDVTDTSLAQFGVNVVASAPSSSASVSGSPPYYASRQLKWTSDVGAATGTWTEIGISNQNTNGNLRSRALILDSGGSPTSFPVLSDEQFQGVYEFRVYPPAADANEQISLSATPYDTTTRALDVNSTTAAQGWGVPVQSTTQAIFTIGSGSASASAFTGDLVDVTETNLSGPLGNRTSVTNGAYGSGNYYQDISARWGSGAGVGQIKTLRLRTQNGGVYQVRYNPTINKLATEELIHNQRIHWARR